MTTETRVGGSPPTPTPLLKLTFLDGAHHVVRYWYHCPRIGDQVFITGADRGSGDDLTTSYGLPPGVVAGTVRGIKWDSDGSVEVYVR